MASRVFDVHSRLPSSRVPALSDVTGVSGVRITDSGANTLPLPTESEVMSFKVNDLTVYQTYVY